MRGQYRPAQMRSLNSRSAGSQSTSENPVQPADSGVQVPTCSRLNVEEEMERGSNPAPAQRNWSLAVGGPAPGAARPGQPEYEKILQIQKIIQNQRKKSEDKKKRQRQ